MHKLYDFFKVLQFQKRIVAAATIWGNTAMEKLMLIWHIPSESVDFHKKYFDEHFL